MNKEILRLAIPNILTNITVPLLGMVDMHLMGYQDSEVFMGAVALGGVIFNLVYWGFAFLRMSISGLAAQAFGRESNKDMAMTLFRGLAIVLVGVTVLLIFRSSVIDLSFWALDGSWEVKHFAADYFYVRVWAAPAAISLMVFSGWFLGMQNAFYPMLISVSINVVNIGTSFLFVRFFDMKVEGVALGSVVAQYSGLIMAIVLFFKKYAHVLKEFNLSEVFRLDELKHFLNVGGDIFIRTMCVIIVFTFFTSKSAGTSNLILSVNSALLQFLFLFSYFLDGFAYAAEAMVGKFVGARNTPMLKRSTKLLFIWGIAFAIIFTLAFGLGGEVLLSLFTNLPEVLRLGKDYLPWLVILPLTGFASFIWDGIYIGATASKLMRNSMIFSTAIFFILFYSLKGSLANHALWLAMNAFMFGRGLSQSFLYRFIPAFRTV